MEDSNSDSLPTGGALDELLPFLKALAEPSRLKIIGLLASQPRSVEELAEALELRPSTVSHHLSALAQAGLVSARAQSYYNIYRLETGVLDTMARKLLTPQTLAPKPPPLALDPYDRKVIANFTFPDGRIKAFPAQRKKFEVILRYVLREFEPGVRYSEKQVNEIIARYHEDTATLRRELVNYGWLAREGGGREYWRTGDGK